MDYTINVKTTEKPQILKFESNHFLVKGQYEYQNIDEAKNSPLATELFYLPFVKSVFIASDFIAIAKYDIAEWDDVKHLLAQKLVDYLNDDLVIVNEGDSQKTQATSIYVESTPNPEVMKFVANRKIVPDVFEFRSASEAKNSPLALMLFNIPFVKQVFFDENYISVSKTKEIDWPEIQVELRNQIQDFLSSGQEAVDTKNQIPGSTTSNDQTTQPNVAIVHPSAETDLGKKIISILEEYVKPAVASDGGNIQFEKYEPETKTVFVLLQGACAGCPSSTFTLKNGIETMLKNMLGDQIHQVVATNG
tara:strand:+ start:7897 stop:8814 length:918 start_codon:yes stop_codon:yes gene_type:complete